MIVLDTHVVSELMKSSPAPVVRDWIRACRSNELYTTSITLAEIRYGIERLPAGRRRDLLKATADDVFAAFQDQILPFDAAAAAYYPIIVTRRDRVGLPVDGFDAQIASICRTHDAALATHNVKDFQDTGIDVIDPWQATRDDTGPTRAISASHHNLANYLSRTRADPAEQRAQCLAAALLRHLTGDIHELTETLRALADEIRDATDRPDAPALPTVLSDVIRLVDGGDGVHFRDLVAALCPDPDTVDQALTDPLATVATIPDRIDRYRSEWEHVITAVVAAATIGHTSAKLTDYLDELGATTDWATLVAALRRVLAGDRDRKQLLAGLDDIDTAILTTVLDRLPTNRSQDT